MKRRVSVRAMADALAQTCVVVMMDMVVLIVPLPPVMACGQTIPLFALAMDNVSVRILVDVTMDILEMNVK